MNRVKYYKITHSAELSNIQAANMYNLCNNSF